MEYTLISTIYDIAPLIFCITQFAPSRIIIFKDKNADDTLENNEKTLINTFSGFIDVEFEEIAFHDLYNIANSVANVIEIESQRDNEILINIGNLNVSNSLGILFGAYSKQKKVYKIFFVEENKNIFDLPILSHEVSHTKRKILEHVCDGTSSVKEIAEKTQISRGMIYNHISELRLKCLLDKEELKITTAGKLAIL